MWQYISQVVVGHVEVAQLRYVEERLPVDAVDAVRRQVEQVENGQVHEGERSKGAQLVVVNV